MSVVLKPPVAAFRPVGLHFPVARGKEMRSDNVIYINIGPSLPPSQCRKKQLWQGKLSTKSLLLYTRLPLSRHQQSHLIKFKFIASSQPLIRRNSKFIPILSVAYLTPTPFLFFLHAKTPRLQRPGRGWVWCVFLVNIRCGVKSSSRPHSTLAEKKMKTPWEEERSLAKVVNLSATVEG